MFHYKSCGLKNIWLVNGYEEIDTPYGKATSIHNLEELHAVIGMSLVLDKPKLTGSELRFLRKELDLSQSNLAGLLDVNQSSIRAWESGRTKISSPAERLIRLLYIEKIKGHKEINEFLERISQLNRDIYQAEKFLLEESSSGWKQAA